MNSSGHNDRGSKLRGPSPIVYLLLYRATVKETYEILKHSSDTLSRTQAFEWHQRFREVKGRVEDDERSEHPQTSLIAENIETFCGGARLISCECLPSGIVVNDADCGIVGSRFISWRRDMDVCKCIVPSRHEDNLNSRRTVNPHVRLVEGEESWEAPDPSQGVLRQNWGATKQNCTVTYMVLKAKANDRRKKSNP
ncbi:uncharacterized protein TNCV_2305201 [Trichonephila clavipes]|nr:uncharacterized protein TNCV_2305201 [Trichonephila clavipes]